MVDCTCKSERIDVVLILPRNATVRPALGITHVVIVLEASVHEGNARAEGFDILDRAGVEEGDTHTAHSVLLSIRRIRLQ